MKFTLPTSHFSPAGIMMGPDGNLWFTEVTSNGCQRGMIGRITPSGKISEFSLPSKSVVSGLYENEAEHVGSLAGEAGRSAEQLANEAYRA